MFIFNIYNTLKYKTYYFGVYDNHCPKFPAFQFQHIQKQTCSFSLSGREKSPVQAMYLAFFIYLFDIGFPLEMQRKKWREEGEEKRCWIPIPSSPTLLPLNSEDYAKGHLCCFFGILRKKQTNLHQTMDNTKLQRLNITVV